MIHMTETRPAPQRKESGTPWWVVECRCGWAGQEFFATQNQARKAGDEHLAEANGTEAADG